MSSISRQPSTCEDCVSIREIGHKLPDNIVLCSDGTVWEICDDGREILIQPEFNSNGTAYLEFAARGSRPGETFKLWLSQAMYRAHCGPIGQTERVVHIDGNRRNLHPSNLRVAPKPTDDFRLVRRHRPSYRKDLLD
jgi:hypothetical protein